MTQPPVNLYVTDGPFGGHGGSQWNDGTSYTGIRKLIIYSGVVIDSIQIVYDDDGDLHWSLKHGGDGGEDQNLITLDPDEYLVSIWGYYSSDAALQSVQSLTIQSNKNTYGPFGTEKGRYFKFPSTSGQILGFIGRSGLYLDSFGAHFRPYSKILESPVIVGPIGGFGGSHWDDGFYKGVKQIIIYSGVVVDSIQIEYDDNGQSKMCDKHGGDGGSEKPVKFDYPREFLVSIEGYYSLESAFGGIQSLTINSNIKSYGPFGTEKGKPFTLFPVSGGKIIGLHGKAGCVLDSIGIYCPTPEPCQIKSVGPFGGQHGEKWDDYNYCGVKKLIIYAGDVIDSIQFKYDDNGSSNWSEKHGKSRGGTKHTIILDYPDEFVLSIKGSYSEVYTDVVVVCSLTIESNRKQYGPFGTEKPNTFETPKTGKIVGFHGRSGDWLDSIGAHIESSV